MLKIFKKWTESYFADEEAIVLILLLAVALAIVVYAGHITGPVLASIIIAYLLQGMVSRFNKLMPEMVSFWLTFVVFMGVCLATVVFAMPLLIKQLTALALELPKGASTLQLYLAELQQTYPDVISKDQMQTVVKMATEKAGSAAELIVSFSFSS